MRDVIILNTVLPKAGLETLIHVTLLTNELEKLKKLFRQ